MDLLLNKKPPTVMWIDLNSCFATIEQQANPLIRDKPVVVAAYTTDNGTIVSPGIEAKRLGIKVGFKVREAKAICKDIIVLPPDPPKYRAVHLRIRNILRDYSPDVFPKSIDEFCVNLNNTPAIKDRDIISIGSEIQKRLIDEIGCRMYSNVGFGTNRFLAKTAASLHKPRGLDVITQDNLIEVYKSLALTDLCGINTKYQARLNMAGIFTPLEFLQADSHFLRKQVFKSIAGIQWHDRLRGWETDDIDFETKSFGQMYSLYRHTNDPKMISAILMKLCEKMGVRMRSRGYSAKGMHIFIRYDDYSYWHTGRGTHSILYSTMDLYKAAQLSYNMRPHDGKVSKIGVSCFDLSKSHQEQLNLFENSRNKYWRASDAMDKINQKYGAFVIKSAVMVGIDDLVIDRISFGGVKELEDVLFI